MKISHNWLQEYFKKELPNPKELADLLNIRAFEVEEIEEKDGDSIFEIKVSPDRAPDCLSHIGIAKEVAVHVREPFVQKEIASVEEQFKTEFSVSLEENSCVRYMAREIKNVVVAESPLELRIKLESIGQRSINTIVDITNLVMYEIGQPMHAFDADKLTGKIIKVGAPTQTSFTTLDNKEIELVAEDITIQDGADNLAIAGVKGGKKAEVDAQTRTILLESANFYQVKVRKTSKRTGIQTDSSKRFENGLTPALAQKGIELASYYVQKWASDASTQFLDVIDVYPRPASPYYTGVSLEEINSKLGLQLSQSDVEEIFDRLGFEHTYVSTKSFVVEEIKKLLGTPHKIAASLTYDAPRCFDCTTLTAYVFAHGGLSIPRMTIDQLFFGKEITKEELEPGDLIFSTKDAGDIHYETVEFLPGHRFEEGVDHVGMYVGPDTLIHSSRFTEKTVEESIENGSNFKHIVGYRRMVDKNEMRFAIRVPDERLDIRGGINIIEEIGRVYGYEKITPVEPALSSVRHPRENGDPGITTLDSRLRGNDVSMISIYDKVNTIKSHLIDLGFNEVVTYTFQKKGDISVIKPLANDKGYLRTGLVKGLSDALDLNFKNKELFAVDCVKIFEIGNTFAQDGEKLMLGIGFKSANKKQKSKQVLEETIQFLSEKLGVSIDTSVTDQQEVVEIELDSLLEKITDTHTSLYKLETKPYVPFSLYPFMTRDIAVWASHSKTKEDIEKIIVEHGTMLLLRYDLFDTYTSEDKTSYGYRLVFQSPERTLTDEEIQPIMEKIYSTLQADSNFEIR
jgi:phenylalanyl-tRNA synthetase beta subunit